VHRGKEKQVGSERPCGRRRERREKVGRTAREHTVSTSGVGVRINWEEEKKKQQEEEK